jgi:hypothetical protein
MSQLSIEDVTPEVIEDDGSIPAPEEDPLFAKQLAESDTIKEEDLNVAEEVPDVVHILEPRYEQAEVILRNNGHAQKYVQKPMSYFGKMEFMSLVGRTLDEAMKGEDGLRVNSLFESTPSSVSDLNAGDFEDLDSFLGLVSKVARYAPDFLKDCYLIWLSVPKSQRVWAREALDNLGDDEGVEIIERFIDQNWEALEHFFTVQVSRVMRRVAERRKKD